jgi:hypothetical protein
VTKNGRFNDLDDWFTKPSYETSKGLEELMPTDFE